MSNHVKSRVGLLVLLTVLIALAAWAMLGNGLLSTNAAEIPTATHTPSPLPEPTISTPEPSATPANRAFVPITFEMAHTVTAVPSRTATPEPPPIP